MKSIRKRFTIPADLEREAEVYARETHRSFSGFLCEALRQHMARYPRHTVTTETTIEKRLKNVEKILKSMRGNGGSSRNTPEGVGVAPGYTQVP